MWERIQTEKEADVCAYPDITCNCANMPSGSQLLLCPNVDNGNHSKSIYVHSNRIEISITHKANELTALSLQHFEETFKGLRESVTKTLVAVQTWHYSLQQFCCA